MEVEGFADIVSGRRITKVGDVKAGMLGFTEIATHVDEDGNVTGAWLIPPGQTDAFIQELAESAKEVMNG